MTNKLLKCALMILATVGLVFTLTLTFANDNFFDFVEKHLAPDHHVENRYAVGRNIFLFLGALGIILFLLKGAWVHTIKKARISEFPFHIKLFYTLFIVLLLCTLFFNNIYIYYKEDGILENITVVLAFASSLILLHIAWLYKVTVRGLIVFILASLLLIFAMEEISWGQRIFGWKTAQIMQHINEQKENNLHNLFNEYFDIVYVLLTGLLASLFFFRDQWISFFSRYPQTQVFVEFMPSRDLFYTGYFYIFLMLFTLIFDRGGETLEAAIALMSLFYSVDVVKKFEPETALERKMLR